MNKENNLIIKSNQNENIISLGRVGYDLAKLEKGMTSYGTVLKLLKKININDIAENASNYSMLYADKKIREKQDEKLNFWEKNIYISQKKNKALEDERNKKLIMTSFATKAFVYAANTSVEIFLNKKENYQVSKSIYDLANYCCFDESSSNVLNKDLQVEMSKLVYSFNVNDKEKKKIYDSQIPDNLIKIKPLNLDYSSRCIIGEIIYSIYSKRGFSAKEIYRNAAYIYEWLGISGLELRDFVKNCEENYSIYQYEANERYQNVKDIFNDIALKLPNFDIAYMRGTAEYLSQYDQYAQRRENVFKAGKIGVITGIAYFKKDIKMATIASAEAIALFRTILPDKNIETNKNWEDSILKVLESYGLDDKIIRKDILPLEKNMRNKSTILLNNK